MGSHGRKLIADYLKKTFDLPVDMVDQLARGSNIARIPKRAFLIQAINNEVARVEDQDVAPEAPEDYPTDDSYSSGWTRLGRR